MWNGFRTVEVLLPEVGSPKSHDHEIMFPSLVSVNSVSEPSQLYLKLKSANSASPHAPGAQLAASLSVLLAPALITTSPSTPTRVTSRKSKHRLKRPSKLSVAEPAPVEESVIRFPAFALSSIVLVRFCVVPSPIAIEAPGCTLKAPKVLFPSSVSPPVTDRSAIVAPPEMVVLTPVAFTLPSNTTPVQLSVTGPEPERLKTAPADSSVSTAPFRVDDVRPDTVVLVKSRVFAAAVVALSTPTLRVALRATRPPRCTLIVPTLIVPLAVHVASVELLIKIVALERLLLLRLN